MTSLFKNKYLVLLLLLIGIVNTDLLVSPMYAMNLGEEEVKEGAESDDEDDQKGLRGYAGKFADGVMNSLEWLGVSREWINHNYRYHREGVPYSKDLHLGDPVAFAERANQAGVFNDDNILKSIGVVRWRDRIVKVGATHEGGYMYKLSMDAGNKADRVDTLPCDNNLFAVFAHHTMLYKKVNDDTLRNCKGHRLVTRNELPVMRRIYNKKLKLVSADFLVFQDDNDCYYDVNGKITSLWEKSTDELPTIDFVFHPDRAVAKVLGTTALATLLTGVGAWKALQLFCRKFFGDKQKDKNESDKNTAVNTVGASVDKEKNRGTEKQELGQQGVQQTEPEVKNKLLE